MDKDEFLSTLRSSLSGSVSAGVINENMNYYEDYINTEIRKGRSEEEVLDTLGDPRLIAKTVADTAPEGEKRGPETVDEDGTSSNDGQYEPGGDVMPWWGIVAIIFAVMLAVYIIGTLVGALLPLLIPAAIVCAVVFLIKHR